MLENKYKESVLPNGIRLIHKEKQGEIAHLVLMVETGTRDELAYENGLAHFVEHTIFKGTQNRKAYHILSSPTSPSVPPSQKTSWPRRRKSSWTRSTPIWILHRTRFTICLKRWSSKGILCRATYWAPQNW